ncbi:MAG: hypothetical protein AAGD13_07865 [Pseudomonadota bacterium]
MCRISCFVFASIVSISSVASARIDLPIPAQIQSIGGTNVRFTGQMTLTPRAACSGVNLSASIGLADLQSKLTKIVQGAVPTVNNSCGERRAIHAVHLGRSGGNLTVKVDGKVGKQFCTRTKVPEVHGFKIKWTLKTVASSTQETNASVSAVFAPTVINNGTAVRARLVSGPETQVSNDALRGLINVFNLNGRINTSIRHAIERALNADTALFQLPPEFRRYGVTLRDANIASWNNQLALRVNGALDIPSQFRPTIMALLGGNCS